MRTIAAGLAVFSLAGPVAAQGGPITQHWPLARISFPMDLNKINDLNPRPTSVRFYAAADRGKFSLIHDKKPTEFDEIVDTKDSFATPKRGFVYDAKADGVEEFAVQYVYSDGKVSPATANLVPTYRVHFDTRPPTVKASALTGSSIRWRVDDDNLADGSVRLEGRLVNETDWQTLKTGRDLGADDTFRWQKIPKDATLEVRVYARDRAGHESRSAPIKLTGGDGKADGGKWENDPPKAPKPGGAFGDNPKPVPRGYGGEELPGGNGPKIEYVCSKKLTVKTKVTHITRSGVTAAQLYVQTPNAAGEWKPATKKEGLNISPESADADRVVAIDYDAPEDGLYGFIVQPISGAGTKQDDPRTGDTPQFLVQVDTTPPKLDLRRVGVLQPGLNGPVVEIEWAAEDGNFPPEPILLEYSTDGKEWKGIVAKTGNTGKYAWEITDKKLWKFQVRGQASDKAGNTTLVTYHGDTKQPQWVLVDLEKPGGTVDKVNGNGGPARIEGGPGGKPIGVEPRIEGAGGLAPAPLPNIQPAVTPPPKPTPPPEPPKPAPPKVDPPKPAPPKVDPPKPDKPLVVPDPPKVPGGVPIPELPPAPPPKKDEPKKDTPKKIDADVELPVPLPPPAIPPVPLPDLPK